MRTRLYRHLRISCVGVIGIAIGLVVGSRLVKTPAIGRQPLHQPGDAEQALSTLIPEVDLEGVPFNEAVEEVRRFSPIPIIVHWDKLAAARLDPRSPVTFRARNVTLRRLLSQLLAAIQSAPAQNVGVKAACASVGDGILISTADDAETGDVVFRSYDVRDLLQPPADPWEVREKPGPLIVYPQAAPQPPPHKDDLARLVEETVAWDSWRDQGGNLGLIRFLDGRLIVLQTWENQRRVGELLAQLRRTAPPRMSPPSTPDLEIWNDALKRYVSTDPSVGEASLRRRIPEVRLDRVPLEQAIATLADLAHAALAADWTAFRSRGITRRTPVSLHLRDADLAEVLRALLDGSGAAQFHVCVDGGCVVLGGLPGYMPEFTTTRVYDLRDWLDSVMGPAPTPAPKNIAEAAKRAELGVWQTARVISLIVETIDPNSWREQGGTAGAIKELNGRLIVTQTWENQERVADLLAALRTDPSRLRPPPAAPATKP